MGNFRYVLSISRYQTFHRRQRFMHQCALQTHRFSFIFCTHLHIHISRILFLILSFLDFVVFVVRTDFSLKSEEMCHFFDKRGYPAVCCSIRPSSRPTNWSAVSTTNVSEGNNNRIPFTLTFHPRNHAGKSIILKNFKLLQDDPDTGRIFS